MNKILLVALILSCIGNLYQLSTWMDRSYWITDLDREVEIYEDKERIYSKFAIEVAKEMSKDEFIEWAGSSFAEEDLYITKNQVLIGTVEFRFKDDGTYEGFGFAE